MALEDSGFGTLFYYTRGKYIQTANQGTCSGRTSWWGTSTPPSLNSRPSPAPGAPPPDTLRRCELESINLKVSTWEYPKQSVNLGAVSQPEWDSARPTRGSRSDQPRRVGPLQPPSSSFSVSVTVTRRTRRAAHPSRSHVRARERVLLLTTYWSEST